MDARRLREQQSGGNQDAGGAPSAAGVHRTQGEQHGGARGRTQEADGHEVPLRRAHADRDRIDRQKQRYDEGRARCHTRHPADRQRERRHERRE